MINYDEIIKKAIGEDFEEIGYHDNCYITVKECKHIMDELVKNLNGDTEKREKKEVCNCRPAYWADERRFNKCSACGRPIN